MKRLLLTAAILTAYVLPAYAQDSTMFSGDVGIVSDYSNRGISRSDEGPALQGRLQLNHPSGVYAGVGASTVDMSSDSDANIEGILFGGITGNYDGIDYNAKVTYTAYPGGDNDDLDYFEFAATGGYDFDVFYASLTWAVSPDYINSSGLSFYYSGDVRVPITDAFSAKGHLGFAFIDDESNYAEDYMDWALGLWYNYAPWDVDVGLQYVDTDLDDNECVESCGSRIILGVSKDFGW